MKRVSMIATVVIVGLIISQCLVAQTRPKRRASVREHVDEVKARPDLGIEYARVGKFKLGSRKTTYRVGEMVNLDLVVVNVSDTPVFFHKLSRPLLEFNANDENGQQILLNDYTTALEATSPQAYQRVEPGHLTFTSFQLLAGCTPELDAFLEQKNKLALEQHGRGEPAYFKGLFDRDLFVNWGQACLAIKKPGKYTITAEQFNDTVVVSSGGPRVKTAVATIRSTPLVITIID